VLQLWVFYFNLLTTNVFAALQLFLSGRAAKIFVGTIVNHQTKPQRGDNFKKVSQVNAFITSNSFFPDNSDKK
jgi:hypothetical protein